jgi:hypothetical protein
MRGVVVEAVPVEHVCGVQVVPWVIKGNSYRSFPAKNTGDQRKTKNTLLYHSKRLLLTAQHTLRQSNQRWPVFL